MKLSFKAWLLFFLMYDSWVSWLDKSVLVCASPVLRIEASAVSATPHSCQSSSNTAITWTGRSLAGALPQSHSEWLVSGASIICVRLWQSLVTTRSLRSVPAASRMSDSDCVPPIYFSFPKCYNIAIVIILCPFYLKNKSLPLPVNLKVEKLSTAKSMGLSGYPHLARRPPKLHSSLCSFKTSIL